MACTSKYSCTETIETQSVGARQEAHNKIFPVQAQAQGVASSVKTDARSAWWAEKVPHFRVGT